ncbi:hypothetical protein U3516DRAFT_746032 [Neocallimastix sp. 'constans']
MDETVILTLLLKELIDIIKKIINYVSDRKIEKYDNNLICKYDRSYYDSSSSEQDINIVFIDNGFNFKHTEFLNNDKWEIQSVLSDTCCPRMRHSIDNHGIKVTDIADCKKYGISPNANNYDIIHNGDKFENLFRGLEYAREK